MMEIPVTTLWQPYASLVAHGYKRVETRSHDRAKKYVGQRIAIHAAKRKIREEELNPQTKTKMLRIFDKWRNSKLAYPVLGDMGPYPLGAVVATAKLVKVAQVEAIAPAANGFPEMAAITGNGKVKTDPFGDFSVGRWLWFLDDIRKLDTPYPATGKQGWWKLDLLDELVSMEDKHVRMV